MGRVNPTGGDGFYYHAQANLLVHGHGFADPYRTTAAAVVPGNAHPPLYTLWLAVSSLFGGDSYGAHKAMSSLAGVLLVVGVALLARELAGERAGILAGSLAALYPPFWIISGLLMPEELYAALIAWLLFLACRWHRRPSWWVAAGTGAVLGLAALTRAEAVLFGPLLLAPLMLLPGRLDLAGRKRVGHLVLAGVVCGALLAPWAIRNAVRFHRFQPFSTNGDELFVYANNPIAYGTSTTETRCTRTDLIPAEQQEGRRIPPQGDTYLGLWYFPWQQYLRCEYGEPAGDASDKSTYWREQGLAYARAHKRRLPVVVAARIGRVWEVYRPFQNAELGRVEGRKVWVSQVGLFAFWSCTLASIAALVVLRRRRALVWPLASAAIAVTLTVAYAYGNERFRLPLDVAVVVGAAIALDAAIGRLRGRSGRPTEG